MARYIVTDLTRFGYPEDVCTAVIDTATGKCLRPMPYLKSDTVKELNVHPGAILSGDITVNPAATNPHIEDASYVGLNYDGPASGDEFKDILDQSLSDSVASGFGVDFANGQKHIPFDEQPICSIITIKIPPAILNIHEDRYKPGRIKASFRDHERKAFGFLSITDRGFYDYAKKHHNDGQLSEVQRYILTQDEIYLRIGLSRRYKVSDRDGYWLQVNGIYTFPSFYAEIRRY